MENLYGYHKTSYDEQDAQKPVPKAMDRQGH